MKLRSAFPSRDRWLTHGLLLASWLTATGHSAEPLNGGRFSLVGGPVTGEGGKSDGGLFTVAGGTGGTSTAPLTGGTFQVTGGLIGVAIVPADMTPSLVLSDDGNARLEWSADAAGYVLQFSPALGPAASWQPVTPAPNGNSFTTPFNQSLRFFRLHKP